MTKLMMKVDLKFLVRSRFIQCWDCRRKMTVSNNRGNVVVVLIGFKMIVMINLARSDIAAITRGAQDV
jgi:hypothetical protein